jgi:hypothetical protein
MLKRTPMKRGQGFKPHVFPLPSKNCTVCERLFTPGRPMQHVCGQRCAMKAIAAKKKAEKQAEKALDRSRKESLKTITQWEHECKDIVQKIARLRDRHDGCISCHMGPNYGGKWHGSHFRPAGNNAAVQFHLWNIHKACAQCNLFKGGNVAGYEPRLVKKIGQDRVDWLKSQSHAVSYTVDYLKRFKAVMGKRLRRMEGRLA